MSANSARFPPALSFSESADLRRLFACVVNGERGAPYITLVCGAGISMDAGLPNWTELVGRILSEVEEDYREWLLEDPIDISRKVSITEALLPKHKHNHEVLRRALYAHIREAARPGILGRAIAKFASTPVDGGARSNPGVRIATLNFDDLLEQALTEASTERGDTQNWRARSIEQVDQWIGQRRPSSVLHLHGLVPSDGADIVEPVVLGEADFVIHGATVREALVRILTSGHVVFVGLSMTDPNIVGALLDSRVRDDEEHARFVVVSPERAPDGMTVEQPAKKRTYEQYARLRGQATAKYLGVTPIFLNSIAQNSQLFMEMALAREYPSEYMSDSSPLRYGNRLLPVLADIHLTAGLIDEDAHSSWSAEQQSQVSSALKSRLEQILVLLERMARELDYSEALGHALQLQLQGPEHFGLFLWVRALPDELGNPEYSLELAGTSAYVHNSAATGRLRIPIAPGTGYPAADAVYYGNARLASLSGTIGPRPIWKSLFAVPVSIRVGGVDVNCGAISVNSTLPADADVPERSVLAHLQPSQQDELAKSLMQVAVDVFPDP